MGDRRSRNDRERHERTRTIGSGWVTANLYLGLYLASFILLTIVAYLALAHRCTQDFTMEGVHVVGGRARGLGDGSRQWGPWAKPRYGVWGTKSPEAEAKCEISVQFLTFSCIKFWI